VTNAELTHDEFEPGERRLWKEVSPRIKQPDYESLRSGELRFPHQRFRIVPNQALQDSAASGGPSRSGRMPIVCGGVGSCQLAGTIRGVFSVYLTLRNHQLRNESPM